MARKAELLAAAERAGVEVHKGWTNAQIEEALLVEAPETLHVEVAEPEPLAGTGVDEGVVDSPVGVPVFDTAIPSQEPGSDADIGVQLDATPSETVVHDTTDGSPRPEDGAA